MWNVLTYFFIAHKPHTKPPKDDSDLETQLVLLEQDIKNQLRSNEKLLQELQRYHRMLRQHKNDKVHDPGKIDYPEGVDDNNKPVVPPPNNLGDPNKVALPVLVIACNRPSVSRTLDQIIRYRTSEERFPIIVSQDCGHGPTADVIKSYGNKVTHLQHPDLSDIPLQKKDQKFKGYYKIARHYKWALNQVFHKLNHDVIIIIEDDLDLSPDFFEYMSALYPILREDPTLWCVSAWNDNGKEGLVMNDPELLYRTDFFPGLGWMLEKKIWLELEDKWPETFWDDWMRHPAQRQDRACIRPEISRSKTFGKIGVSRGQFYDKYLKFIQLNTVFVPFTQKDLSYLKKENYDEMFVKMVYDTPLMSVREVQQALRPEEKAVHVLYTDKNSFKSHAKALGLMDDLKSGVPRAGYRGIVSFMYKNRRVYLTPPPNWTGYDPSWS